MLLRGIFHQLINKSTISCSIQPKLSKNVIHRRMCTPAASAVLVQRQQCTDDSVMMIRNLLEMTSIAPIGTTSVKKVATQTPIRKTIIPGHRNQNQLFPKIGKDAQMRTSMIPSVLAPQLQNVLRVPGRNSRKAKRANHGKRPCSHKARRAKRRRFGNPRRNF